MKYLVVKIAAVSSFLLAPASYAVEDPTTPGECKPGWSLHSLDTLTGYGTGTGATRAVAYSAAESGAIGVINAAYAAYWDTCKTAVARKGSAALYNANMTYRYGPNNGCTQGDDWWCEEEVSIVVWCCHG